MKKVLFLCFSLDEIIFLLIFCTLKLINCTELNMCLIVCTRGNKMHLKNNFLLYLALVILAFCSYITAYGEIPFSDMKYQLTLTDSLIFISLYIVLQMIILLYMEKASSVKFDIGLSVISFIGANLFFSYVGIGNLLELYNYFNNNPDFIADPQKFAAFTIMIALLVDMVPNNIFNFLYLKRVNHFTYYGAQEAEEKLKEEQIKKEEKEKAANKKRVEEIKKQQKKLDDERIIASANS